MSKCCTFSPLLAYPEGSGLWFPR